MNVKKFLNTKSGRLLVAAVLGAGVLVGVTVAANGAVKPDCKSLSYPLCPRSVAASQVVDNSLPASKIVPADRNAFLKDTDVYGKSGVAKDFDPVAIAKIGGSFKTNKTKVGEFTLQPGTWLLNSTAFFARTTAGAPARGRSSRSGSAPPTRRSAPTTARSSAPRSPPRRTAS